MKYDQIKKRPSKILLQAVKKTHNVKNNVLTTPDRRILWFSRTCVGSMLDKKICDNQPIQFPSDITLWQDMSFLGHNSKNVTVIANKKAKRQ